MTVEERVANGIRFFEQHRPGWHERIDLQSLEVRSLRSCPASQVFRGSSNTSGFCYALDLAGAVTTSERERFARAHGFQGDDYQDCDALNEEWRRQLTEIRVTRRAPERVAELVR